MDKVSPLRKRDLTGLALQMKMMADLTKAHAKFNDGIQKLSEYAKTVYENAQKVQAHMDRIKSLPKGPKGDTGETPEIDIEGIKSDILAQIPTPIDGETPSMDEIVKAVLPFLPKAESRVVKAPEIDHEKLADLVVKKISDGKKLKIDHVAGLRGEVDSYRAQLAGKVYGKDTWARGGGDTVVAGSNITFGKDANGNKIINASGGTGGGGFSTVIPIGTIDGNNRIFTASGKVSVAVVDSAIDVAAVLSYDIGSNITTITYSSPPLNNVYAFIGGNAQIPSGTINTNNRTFIANGQITVAIVDSVVDVAASISYNSGTNQTTIIYSTPPQYNVYAF